MEKCSEVVGFVRRVVLNGGDLSCDDKGVLVIARHVADCERCRVVWRKALSVIQAREGRGVDVACQLELLLCIGYPPKLRNVTPLLVRGLLRVISREPPTDSNVKCGILQLLQASLRDANTHELPAGLAVEAVRKLQSDADPSVRSMANAMSLIDLERSENGY